LKFRVRTTYPEELLGPGNDVSHYKGGAKRINDVFVVWVKNKSSKDST
jgi:hypothetical protein